MKKYLLIKKRSYRQVSLIKQKIFFVVLITIVLVVFLFFTPRLIGRMVDIFWMPFNATRIWMTQSSDSFPMYFRDRNILIEEIEQLRQQISVNEAGQNTLRKLEVENANFRQLLDAVPQERLLARVVARPNQLPYDMLLIDQGFEDGVVLNSPIFLGKNQVIGYVSKVHAETSLVTLVTTPGFSATAYIVGPNIYTYTEGMGGGIVRVKVPQGIILTKDDLVILPAIDSGVYGAIQEISTSPTQPERYGYLSIGTSLQSLQYVTVGREAVTPNNFLDAEKLVGVITSDLFLVPVPDKFMVFPNATSSATEQSPAPVASTSQQ